MHPRHTRAIRRTAITCLVTLAFLALPAVASVYVDVTPEHPFSEAVADLTTRGIISGYPDGTFRPDTPTLRQHFAKLLVLTLGLPVTESDACGFGDVYVGGPATLYPDNYIAVAAARDIVKGLDSRTFRPEIPVTRAQAVTMVVRAVEQSGGFSFEQPPADWASSWGDFSPDHQRNAALAEYNGLLAGLGSDDAHPAGDPASLDPWAPMPRGEVAQLLHNLLLLEDSGPEPPDDGGGGSDPPAIHAPDAALSASYASCASTSCHSLNLYEQHVVRPARGCDVCHEAPAGTAMRLAIADYGATGTKQGCRVCHGPAAGSHRKEHGLVNPGPGGCALCHAADLLTVHVTQGSATCTSCHGDAVAAGIKSVVDAFAAQPANPRCEDCHPTFHAGNTSAHTSSEGPDCAVCHRTSLTDEHSRATSSSAQQGCATCHPLPASFFWAGRCDECHRGGGLAPIAHAAANKEHLSSKAGCVASGCHAGDVRTLHAATAKGCATCHSASGVPATIDCATCHGSAHMVREPYKNSCDTCHSISGPGASLHDFHAVSRGYACSNCHGPTAPGCAGASCHEHSSQQIHNVDAHQAKACTFCHKSGVP